MRPCNRCEFIFTSRPWPQELKGLNTPQSSRQEQVKPVSIGSPEPQPGGAFTRHHMAENRANGVGHTDQRSRQYLWIDAGRRDECFTEQYHTSRSTSGYSPVPNQQAGRKPQYIHSHSAKVEGDPIYVAWGLCESFQGKKGTGQNGTGDSRKQDGYLLSGP